MIVSSNKRSTDQAYILSLRVPFQEIPLRRMCIMNVLEEGEIGNI